MSSMMRSDGTCCRDPASRRGCPRERPISDANAGAPLLTGPEIVGQKVMSIVPIVLAVVAAPRVISLGPSAPETLTQRA